MGSVKIETFIERHLAALEQDEARHNLILGILERARKGAEEVRFWSLGDGSACAVQTPPYYVVLGDVDASQCRALARELADLDFAGCMGQGGSAVLLAECLGKMGIPHSLNMPQKIYVLDQAPIHPSCSGSARRAGPEDFDLFYDWFYRFSREAVPNETPHPKERMKEPFSERPTFFWEVNGIPVSMAARTRETKSGSNISFVYTVPEFRGKGYGGAVTAFACEDVFREGKKTCFLYTDLRNPISNRVYQKIGFRPWCESNSFVREKNFYEKRPATSTDLKFVTKLHHETLRDYVEPIWGWSEERQDEIVARWFKPERIQIIRQKGKDVGLIVVEKRADDIYLESISVIPELQRKGLGAAVIRDAMLEARASSLPLRLQVLKSNPRARALYERLGFTLEKEIEHHFVFVHR